MPRGPQGQKRPADAIGCAIAVARLATGEFDESVIQKSGKVRSGRAGAAARAHTLSPEQRKTIAKNAAAKRWER